VHTVEGQSGLISLNHDLKTLIHHKQLATKLSTNTMPQKSSIDFIGHFQAHFTSLCEQEYKFERAKLLFKAKSV
jgi:hypothetical protein